MESAFLNKAAAAILLSVAMAWLASLLGAVVVPLTAPAKPAFMVPGLEHVAIAPYLAHANQARGAKLVQEICSSCHAVDGRTVENVGPALAGVVGRPIAALPTYAYSPALKSLHTQVWSEQNLSDWLTAPARFAPGTRMSLMGLPNVAQRADIIVYLQSLSSITTKSQP